MVAVTVMHVMFVLHVCMLKGCDGDGNAGAGAGRCVVAVSVWCEYIGGTRGSRFMSTANDVLEMIVVRVVRGVGGVCEMCMHGSGRGRRCGGEWVRGLGLAFTNPVGTGGVWDVYLCLGCWGVGGLVGLDYLWRWMVYLYIVLCGYLRILGAPSVQSCCTLSISAS